MYLNTKNENSRSRLSKVRERTERTHTDRQTHGQTDTRTYVTERITTAAVVGTGSKNYLVCTNAEVVALVIPAASYSLPNFGTSLSIVLDRFY